jgi:tetratricopeptide (TPR) repeat protein
MNRRLVSFGYGLFAMKKNHLPPARGHATVTAADRLAKMLYEQGRYAEALAACLQVTRSHPAIANAWIDAALNSVKLERWQDAIRYGQTALARGGNTLALYDALAHAHSKLGQWDEVRRYGLRALTMRAQRFGGEPPLPPPEPGAMPPLPSAQTRQHNIIAFSLFGGNSKYCEPAVLNVQEQPRIYPHWVCRFYVDNSVPEYTLNRLRNGGAQIVVVDGPATRWPGPMWRFLALNDPHAHRILFRDADSVISRREVEAVDQWLASDKRFHIIRDSGSHTELMLAGLWGVVAGSLPQLDKLMERFLSAPLESRHFADQYFLRKYVWPYARTSLMQHDSIFGFMNGVPFPDGVRPDDVHVFHVGHAEGSPYFTAPSNFPDGSEMTWELSLIETPDNGGPPREELVCTYPCVVSQGAVKAHIPARYARRIEQGTARVRLMPGKPAAKASAP